MIITFKELLDTVRGEYVRVEKEGGCTPLFSGEVDINTLYDISQNMWIYKTIVSIKPVLYEVEGERKQCLRVMVR